MREAGIAFEVREYPSGDAGIEQSLQVMAQKMRDGRNDADLKGWAQNELHKAGFDGRTNPGTVRQRTQVLLDAYRAQTIYSPDPHGTEWIQSPAATLCLRPGLCMRGGDCDDGAVALGSATLSIGIPTVIVKQSFAPGLQQHVLIAVQDENGQWLYADPSTDMNVGEAARSVSEERYDPMDMRSLSTGNSGAEIVSLGRVFQLREQVGIGAVVVSNPFVQAQSDLDNQVKLVIQAGDTYLTQGDYGSAVRAYQAAGGAGSSSVGPEIDLAGASWVTQPLTHQAWVSNADLQLIASMAPATKDDASTAQTYIRNMLALWQQAIYAGVEAVSRGQRPPSPGITVNKVAAVTIGLGAVAGIVWAVHKRKRGRRR